MGKLIRINSKHDNLSLLDGYFWLNDDYSDINNMEVKYNATFLISGELQSNHIEDLLKKFINLVGSKENIASKTYQEDKVYNVDKFTSIEMIEKKFHAELDNIEKLSNELQINDATYKVNSIGISMDDPFRTVIGNIEIKLLKTRIGDQNLDINENTPQITINFHIKRKDKNFYSNQLTLEDPNQTKSQPSSFVSSSQAAKGYGNSWRDNRVSNTQPNSYKKDQPIDVKPIADELITAIKLILVEMKESNELKDGLANFLNLKFDDLIEIMKSENTDYKVNKSSKTYIENILLHIRTKEFEKKMSHIDNLFNFFKSNSRIEENGDVTLKVAKDDIDTAKKEVGCAMQ